ncbi:MAG: MFS transporter [Chloroflexi bacterium]|nr:MFS transporter [Chloroflexota bacterium]
MESSSRNRILLVLFIGVLMGALDIAIVGPALPAIRKSFGVDDRAVAWIFTTYVLFNLISVPLMAKLSDLFGRRNIYILNVSLFALGSLIVALAPDLSVMLIGRAIQGLGAGGVFPVASAVIGDTFPPEKRGSALGLIGAVFGIAFLVGPLLAGAILFFVSWHWLFIVNLPLAAIVIAMAMRVLPSARAAQQRQFDFLGMATLAVMLAALTFGVNQLDTKNFATSIASMNVLPFLGLVVVLFPVFLAIETHAGNPVMQLKLFQSRQVIVIGLVAIGAGLGEAAIVFVPALVVAAFGVSSSTASFMLLPAVLAMAFGSPTAGRMLDRVGSRIVLLIGTAVTTAGLFVIALLGANIIFFYVSVLLAGVGLGVLLGAPLRYVMLNEAPASERASAQAALTLFTSTGQLFGGAMVGAVAASFGGGISGYTAAFLTVGIVMLAMTALTLALKNRAAELDTARQNHAAVETQRA